MYRELKDVKPRGLAAGNIDSVTTEGSPPKLIGKLENMTPVLIQKTLEHYEAQKVKAPIENAIIITRTGDIYHCTGGLNSLETIEELGEKLYGAVVTHNHPKDSVNEYSFSDADKDLFIDFRLARLRGIDERFIYEFNRNPKDRDNIVLLSEANEFNARHGKVVELAQELEIGYRRWAR